MLAPAGVKWTIWAAWGGACFLAAGLGTLATELGPWYYGLQQPPWKPADALFGPAWTIIFALIALSGVHLWIITPPGGARGQLIGIYALNLCLNLGWSVLFFTLKRPDWAFWEALALLASIVLMIATAQKRSARAAKLLVPYLLWVIFATVLTWEVSRLNGPFS